jgi:hypothetical protein
MQIQKHEALMAIEMTIDTTYIPAYSQVVDGVPTLKKRVE